MSHAPNTEMSNNPYQAYPNPSNNNSNNASGYASQSQYPGGAMNQNERGVARSDQYNSVGPSVVGAFSPNLSPHFNATTALLALLSLVSLYEGVQRVITYSNSYLPWSASDDSFPAAALLIAGIWQVIYSLSGLFIAIWALIFDWHSVALTTLALGSQFVGWYTVIVFSLAQPAYAARYLNNSTNYPQHAYGNDQPDANLGYQSGAFNNGESKASYVFGWILPLFALDTALLAGLIFFTLQLMAIQMNNVNELHSPHYYARRLSFWSLLEGLYGVSTLIYAAIYLGESWDKFNLDGSYHPDYFYPNVTVYAAITLITGILFIILSFMGCCGACANNLHASNAYIGLSWFTFLWVVGAHIMGQLGQLPSNFNQASWGLAELGLFFGVLMITKYLAYKSATIETVHRGNYIVNKQGRSVV